MERTLDIEQHDELRRYLVETGRVRDAAGLRCDTLGGGVSNRTVRVEFPDGRAWVIKQALDRLRVKDDWRADPRRVHREALGLRWLGRLLPAGSVPAFLFEDSACHLLAMEAVPEPQENWKTRLLAGGVESGLVQQFGQLLGWLHRRASERAAEAAVAFEDRSFFVALRVEPYYRAAAGRQPASAAFFERLIGETLSARLTLVQGDYSPKNVLVHRGRLVLLDHEVIHWGDPAFDVGFALTHLLSKANHRRAQRGAFLEAAELFWESYRGAAGSLGETAGFEARAVRHTLGCLLARVDGRSPLEYLSETERERQRALVLAHVASPPVRVRAWVAGFGRGLEG